MPRCSTTMNKNKNYPPFGLYSVAFSIITIFIFTIVMFTKATILVTSNTGQIVLGLYVLLIIAIALLTFDILSIAPKRKFNNEVMEKPTRNRKVTVVLTAYNDELSIQDSVEDFLSHQSVQRVLVIDNNSTDRTSKFAKDANAIVIHEERQGYGHCVYRALEEGSRYLDTEIVILCEGDRTFRGRDIDKFMAYEEHGDIISGTRISEQLRMSDTQLTSFIYFGNFFVGKLLELKHLGKGTFTDVGTTYKLCKSEYLRNNLEKYNPSINHEFNAHFLDKSLEIGARIVEVPVTFYRRVGISKGGNRSNYAAILVGLKMIKGIIFGWPRGAAANEK
jgi:glycosyltransferase involved in cell wall biosynthesis